MQSESKPFGARAISSFSRRFQLSLLKLTCIYVGILAIILFLSSGILYSYFSSRLEYRYREVRPHLPEYMLLVPRPPLQEELQKDLVYSLLLVNGLLLLVAGAASYFLAHITLEPLKEAFERQRQFLGDASHELRTPLSVLRMDLENELADSSAAGKTKERANSNLEEVERMSKLVEDLLILSRLDEDHTTSTKHTTVDVLAMVRHTAERLEPLAHRNKVTFALPEETAPITITTHEDLLLRSLTNVVKNAIIYNKIGGKVTLSVQQTQRAVQIVIADTGIGISKDDLSKIFDRFYRVDKSRSRASGGSGLGLSIVKTSLDKIGGSINIQSELGKGTIIIITLPR